MTREEMIGKAADAILRIGGFDPDREDLGVKHAQGMPASGKRISEAHIRFVAVERATAALEAVGAWEVRVAANAALECLQDPGEMVAAHLGAGCLADVRTALSLAESK